MAAPPTPRRARASRPLSPPADPDLSSRINSRSPAQSQSQRLATPADVADFFAVAGGKGSLPPTPDATPPPSLPPGSPDKRRTSKGKGKRRATAQDESDGEGVLAKYALDEPRSPILPRVKLSFPTIFSDDEDDDWLAGPSTAGVRPKAWSQTTTTTTTRRTERRVWRNSTGQAQASQPANQDDEYSSRATPSSWPSIPFPRPASTSTSSPGPSSRRAPSIPAPARRSTRRSFPGAFAAPPTRPARPSLFSSYSPSYSLAPTAPTGPPPPFYLKPLMNVFLLLAVSAVAFCSVSAVLVAGFTLTLYDDCGKRVEDLRRGLGEGQKRVGGAIGGVREGVGKVLGGAVETFAAIRSSGESSTTSGTSSPRARTTSDPGSDDTLPASSPTRRRAHRGRSRTPRRRPPPPTPPSTDNGWTSDENILPYDVPRPSPTSTRAASPAPSNTSSGRGKLPPRPPLRILLPSIVLALLWTIWQIASGVWTKKPRTRDSDDEKPRRNGTTSVSPARAR